MCMSRSLPPEAKRGITDAVGSSTKLLLVLTREAKLKERISASCASCQTLPHIFIPKLQATHYESICATQISDFLELRHYLEAYKLQIAETIDAKISTTITSCQMLPILAYTDWTKPMWHIHRWVVFYWASWKLFLRLTSCICRHNGVYCQCDMVETNNFLLVSTHRQNSAFGTSPMFS